MASTALNLPVTGTLSQSLDGPQLVLTHRLDGHDTFLKGSLGIGDERIPVRILTLDDVTVLRPTDPAHTPAVGASWEGTLHLPHGLRPRAVPTDLRRAAGQDERSLEALDEAELRYVLTFLGESTTLTIRQARVNAIVSALPALPTQRRPQ